MTNSINLSSKFLRLWAVIALALGPLIFAAEAQAYVESRISSAESTISELKSKLTRLQKPARTNFLVGVAENNIASAKNFFELKQAAENNYSVSLANEQNALQQKNQSQTELNNYGTLSEEQGEYYIIQLNLYHSYPPGPEKSAQLVVIQQLSISPRPTQQEYDSQKSILQGNVASTSQNYAVAQQQTTSAHANMTSSNTDFENSVTTMNISVNAASTEYTTAAAEEVLSASSPSPSPDISSNSSSTGDSRRESPSLSSTEIKQVEVVLNALVQISPDNLSPKQAAQLQSAAELVLENTSQGSNEYVKALEALLIVAESDDVPLNPEIAALPVVGAVLEQAVDAFNQLGNLGADMAPSVRKDSEAVVVSAVIAGQVTQMAITSATTATLAVSSVSAGLGGISGQSVNSINSAHSSSGGMGSSSSNSGNISNTRRNVDT